MIFAITSENVNAPALPAVAALVTSLLGEARDFPRYEIEETESGAILGAYPYKWTLTAPQISEIIGQLYALKAAAEAAATEAEAYRVAHPPVPSAVTRRQLFLWLNRRGITRAMLRESLAGNEAALIELEEATRFERAHPLVAQCGVTLNLNSDQIDEAFRAAALL